MGKQQKKQQKPQQKAPQKAPACDFIQEPLPFEEGPVLLTTLQACELLGGISRSTFHRLGKSGDLSGCRVDLGGVVRYHKHSLIRWVDSQLKRL